MMGRKAEPRKVERKGFKAEIIGPSRNCQLWINGRLHSGGIKSLRAAKDVFRSYTDRHAAA